MTDRETPIEDLLNGLPEDWEHNLNTRDPGILGVSAVNWRTLDDDTAPEVWTRLRDWVDWFLRRYDIPPRKIPPCWYRHGALVEELSALHTAWLVSFDTMDAGYGPIGWHERLAIALPRITTWYNGQCATAHAELPGLTRTGTPDAEWVAWIRTSHTQ